MGNYQRVIDTEEHILAYHRREDEGKRLQEYLPDALSREWAVVDLEVRERSLRLGRESPSTFKVPAMAIDIRYR